MGSYNPFYLLSPQTLSSQTLFNPLSSFSTDGHTTKSESIFRPTTSNYIHVDEGTYPQYLDGEGSSGDLSNYEQDGAGGSYDTYQHDSKSDGRVIFA